MPEILVFVFHHNFYPKPKVDLEDAEITPEIKEKVTDLQQNYDDIISQHSSDIGLTHLEEVKINTDPNLPPVANKICKQRSWKFIRGWINWRSMSPYATPITVIQRKSKSWASLAETKWLVIDYRELTSN